MTSIINQLIRRASSKYKLKEGGFTLFELLVVIAIIALMTGIIVSKFDDWFDVNIKRTTKKLGGTVRYLHDKASTENLYIRLILDFEKNSYWVEATTEQFLLMTKDVAEEVAKEAEEEPAEEEAEKGEAAATEGEETGEAEEKSEAVEKYRTPEFGAVDEFLLKPVVLPDGVFIKDVYTSHDQGPVSSGQAFIYFFPNGFIEPAVINLRNEEDTLNYSIKINPLTGTTYLSDQYKTLE